MISTNEKLTLAQLANERGFQSIRTNILSSGHEIDHVLESVEVWRAVSAVWAALYSEAGHLTFRL